LSYGYLGLDGITIHQQGYDSCKNKKEGIQWVLPTSRSIALNVVMILHSPRRNRNFSHRKVIPMNQSVAFPAVRQGNPKEAGVEDPTCKSIRQYALNVVRIRKFHSNPDRADLFIAALAIVK
jgi:hypothetical protein